jgi:meso-butanediol dehydrogenase / (S,S)-butanediol dehydrogenase / diacetyl reductase
MRLEGKTAIVTGGGTGIGAAIAKRFREEGANVVVSGRRQEPLEEVAMETGAIPIQSDASDSAQVKALVAETIERFGGLDIVVANAGASARGSVHELSDDEWHTALEGNLSTAFYLCREALPTLIERKGNIIIVSSLAGHFAGPAVVGYTASKHALHGLVKAMTRDYTPQGVRVNGISPGWVKTPMADRGMTRVSELRDLTIDGAYDFATRNVPLRRASEPDEIANIALFLASDEASCLTGNMILADGGAQVVDLPTVQLFD